MRTAAIVPVKSFAAAKSRLRMRADRRAALCESMLASVLRALASAELVESTLVVTREERAAALAGSLGAEVVHDKTESGVNDAVRLADARASEAGYDATLVVPQDLPLLCAADADALLGIAPARGALIVPSRHLDGTNALVRSPPCALAPRYDEGGYCSHVDEARARGVRARVAFLRGFMIDVDTREDLEYAASRDGDSAASLRAALI